MSDEIKIEKIDLDKVDWRGSREFFESLGEALDKLDDKDESYDFTWVGKRKAIIEAGAPINKTFRPDVESSKNWDTTENLFIEGDNLDALKLLQECYLGKVKMIYIDPPYNTGKDFVYHDNFKATTADYDEDTEYKDSKGNIQFKKNEKSNGRYHSDWLSMMYPRLKLARNLLSDDGVIFISIDDNEQTNLKKLCDEVFGEDNFVGQFIWRKKSGGGQADEQFVTEHEYILCFSRSASFIWRDEQKEVSVSDYRFSDGEGNFKITKLAKWGNTARREDRPSMYFSIEAPDGMDTFPIAPDGGDGRWRVGRLRMEELNSKNLIHWQNGKSGLTPYEKEYYSSGKTKVIKSRSILYNLANTGDGSNSLTDLFGRKDIFENPKPIELIDFLIKNNLSEDDIVLDFFSGSGTLAHATIQRNAQDQLKRKWIVVQLPEETDEKSEAFKAGYKTIPEISRERICRAGDKIAKEHPGATVDYGFRALKIADTNYKEVYKSAGEYQQSTLLDTVDNIKDDRSGLDLLYGVLTQSAFELNRPLETSDIAGATVFLYDYFSEASGMVACFANNVPEDTIKAIAKLKPLTAVFRDSSFNDSQSKVNLSEHFRILSPDTKVKVI